MTSWLELEQLAKAATPGPWHIKKCPYADSDRACGVSADPSNRWGEYEGICYSDARDECSHFMTAHDANFIAAANPSAILKLLDTLKRARELAMIHVGDGDELGEIARALLSEIGE